MMFGALCIRFGRLSCKHLKISCPNSQTKKVEPHCIKMYHCHANKKEQLGGSSLFTNLYQRFHLDNVPLNPGSLAEYMTKFLCLRLSSVYRTRFHGNATESLTPDVP